MRHDVLDWDTTNKWEFILCRPILYSLKQAWWLTPNDHDRYVHPDWCHVPPWKTALSWLPDAWGLVRSHCCWNDICASLWVGEKIKSIRELGNYTFEHTFLPFNTVHLWHKPLLRELIKNFRCFFQRPSIWNAELVVLLKLSPTWVRLCRFKHRVLPTSQPYASAKTTASLSQCVTCIV